MIASLRIAILLALAVAVAACGTTPPATPAPSALPAPSHESSRTPRTTATGMTHIDDALLAHLPTEVDGLPVERSEEGLAEAVRDPAIAANAEAIAAALVSDPATGEFAFASLVRLRSGVMSDGFYRGWRDSFDDGACSQAGGVAGHAEAAISDRDVFIGTCSGGVRTYHVWLGNSGVLISVSAVGERRLGERLIEALRD